MVNANGTGRASLPIPDAHAVLGCSGDGRFLLTFVPPRTPVETRGGQGPRFRDGLAKGLTGGERSQPAARSQAVGWLHSTTSTRRLATYPPPPATSHSVDPTTAASYFIQQRQWASNFLVRFGSP